MIATESPVTADVEKSTNNAYVTFAGGAAADQSVRVFIGTGIKEQETENGVTISYDNRRVQPGQVYYFFVRLYSDVVGDGVGVSSPILLLPLSLSLSCRGIKQTSMIVLPRGLKIVSLHQNCR